MKQTHQSAQNPTEHFTHDQLIVSMFRDPLGWMKASVEGGSTPLKYGDSYLPFDLARIHLEETPADQVLNMMMHVCSAIVASYHTTDQENVRALLRNVVIHYEAAEAFLLQLKKLQETQLQRLQQEINFLSEEFKRVNC